MKRPSSGKWQEIVILSAASFVGTQDRCAPQNDRPEGMSHPLDARPLTLTIGNHTVLFPYAFPPDYYNEILNKNVTEKRKVSRKVVLFSYIVACLDRGPIV